MQHRVRSRLNNGLAQVRNRRFGLSGIHADDGPHGEKLCDWADSIDCGIDLFQHLDRPVQRLSATRPAIQSSMNRVGKWKCAKRIVLPRFGPKRGLAAPV
jgi:hypothetical protein